MPTLLPPIPPLKIEGRYVPSINAKNLLFLGDGFSNSDYDKKLFKLAVREVKKRFFRIRPFNMKEVRDRFVIYTAFTPSLDGSSGISCDRDINAVGNKGYPTDSTTGGLRLKPVKSALGLQYGKIPRTFGAKLGDGMLIPDLIKKLSHPHESLGSSAVPQCWERPTSSTPVDPYLGKDYGLVIVLVNDDVRAGSTLGFPGATLNFYPYFGAAVSVGVLKCFNLVGLAVNPRDHVPLSLRRTAWNSRAHGVAHELGHTHFDLGDEYEVTATPAGRASTRNYYSTQENQLNLVTSEDILDVAHRFIDPGKVGLLKWNKPLYPGSADRTITQRVLNYFLNPRLPFASIDRPSCADVTDDYDGSAEKPPGTLRGKLRHPAKIIGIYEGGDRLRCGIFRPAGICKMRSLGYWGGSEDRQYYERDFCYICMQAIVEKIEPALLEKLAKRYYPG